MKLSLYEQETIILYNQAEATAEVYTHDPRLLEKLRRLAEKNNALFIPGGALLPAVPELTGDHVHPNDLGHLMIGRRLAERLKAVE